METEQLTSIIIPVFNEQDSLPKLFGELEKVIKGKEAEVEIVLIDDGSTDNSLSIIHDHAVQSKNIKYLSFQRNLGKGAAYNAGFKEASGDILVTIDSDLQDDPAEIPRLLKKIEDGADLVIGWKQNRKDPAVIVAISYISNLFVSIFMGKRIHDINCGLKAMRKELIEQVRFSGDLFRMLPIMANAKGYKVEEIVVTHRKRLHGKSKYGWNKVFAGSVDMLTALFLSKFATSPAHFFGSIGAVIFSAGFIADLYVTYLKFTTGSTQGHIPLLIFGVLALITGLQLISTGFLAELIVSMKNKQDYPVKARYP